MKPASIMLCVVLLLLFPVGAYQAHAQILNAGFEDWTDGNPNDWSTSNFPPIITNVTQVSDAHEGASAVQGDVVSYLGSNFPPFIVSGQNSEGFPVNTQHPALHGWYKFTPVGDDILLVTVVMTHADTGVGSGSFGMSTPQSSYREFAANIIYFYPQVPDACSILAVISASGGLLSLGSMFIMDDLAFGPVSSVDASGNVIPASFELFQNYPNPFNPKTLITYSLPQAGHAQLVVFNTLGEQVATLVDAQMDAGSYRTEFDGTALPSGTYFYRLQATPHLGGKAGGFSQVRKLLLVK